MIDKSTYRELVSACIKMSEYAEHKLIFLTATFPFHPAEVEAQTIFKNFVKNLKTNYGLKKYVWVKEPQNKNNDRIHYHLLCEIPYANIQDMQSSYNSAILHVKSNASVNRHSLRLPPRRKWGRIVNDSRQVAKYMGKYMSKTIKVEWKLPVYAISKSLYPLFYEVSDEKAREIIEGREKIVFSDSHLYAKVILKRCILPDILRDIDVF